MRLEGAIYFLHYQHHIYRATKSSKDVIVSRTLKIGELAKLSGATTKTIRYYELLGLLHEPERTDS